MAETGFDKLYGKIPEGMSFPVQQGDRLDILNEVRLPHPPPVSPVFEHLKNRFVDPRGLFNATPG